MAAVTVVRGDILRAVLRTIHNHGGCIELRQLARQVPDYSARQVRTAVWHMIRKGIVQRQPTLIFERANDSDQI